VSEAIGETGHFPRHGGRRQAVSGGLAVRMRRAVRCGRGERDRISHTPRLALWG
jgi:hypothetical protein